MINNIVTVPLDKVWGPWPTDVPIYLDFHLFDIPETLKLAIENAPDNVVAISFGVDEMPERWLKMLTEWCNKRDIIPIWWRYPKDE